MYTPDRSIVKQLREIDPDLDVVWDSGIARWRVLCMGKPVIIVRNNDGSYRPLDGRIVTQMREQAWEYRTYFGTFSMLDREQRMRNREFEEKKRLAARDEFRQYMIEDGYKQVVGCGTFNGWSGNA